MVAENPAPDNDTMETLIETNEELSKAQNQHQRAVLNARKTMGISTPPGPSPQARTESGFAAPPGPPPNLSNPVPRKSMKSQPPIPPPGETLPNVSDDDDDGRNPFADPDHTTNPENRRSRNITAPNSTTPRLDIEPYHPGFQTTQSYADRQDSSVGNTTVHAAAPVENDSATDYGTQAGNKAPVYRF